MLHFRLRFVVVTTHVYTHQYVAFLTHHTVQWYWVCNATVYQNHPIAMHRLVERWQRYRSTYSLKQTALTEHHLMPSHPVGSHSTIWNGQVLDLYIGHKLHYRLYYARTFYQMVQAEREVGKLQHLLTVNGLHPVAELAKLTSGINTAYQGTHRTSGNGCDTVSLRLKFLYGTDMSQTTRSATRQY